MELLRHVARAQGAGASVLVREAAAALAGLEDDPAAIVTACRRLVDGHPTVGPMWSLAARVLTAADPVEEAWRVAEELEEDYTPRALSTALPDDATVVLLGWPAQAARAVRRRGDVRVLLVESGGESAGLARWLRQSGTEVEDVPDAGLAAAVAQSGLVLLEAAALGPDGLVAAAGSRAAAAVARDADVPVWAVAGAGRPLPGPLWSAVVDRMGRSGGPAWARTEEVVPLRLVDQVVGPAGLVPAPEAAFSGDDACPVAPELLRPLV